MSFRLIYDTHVLAGLPCNLKYLQKKNNKYQLLSPQQRTKQKIIKQYQYKYQRTNKKTILFNRF